MPNEKNEENLVLPDDQTESGGVNKDLLSLLGLSELPQDWNAEDEKNDLREATKDYFDRRQEIDKALQDPDSFEMKESRTLASNLGAAIRSPQDQLQQVLEQLNTLGEVMQGITNRFTVPNMTNVVTALASFTGRYDGDGGRDDLSQKLKVENYKPGDGKRRKDGQALLTKAQGTLLFLADDYLKSGNLTGAIEVLKNSRFRNAVAGRDSWLTDSVSQAVNTVDLENDSERAAVLDLRHVGYNLYQSQLDEIGRRGESPELNAYDKVSLKISEAVKTDERMQEERKRQEQKAMYEKRKQTEYDSFVDSNITDGQNALSILFQSEQYRQPKFRREGGGLSMIGSALEKDYALQDKLDYRKLTGTRGYLDVLQRLSEDNELFEQVVRSNVDEMYSDLGMKSKLEYEQADEKEAFVDHIRSLTRTEIYARALGFLEGAIIYGPEESGKESQQTMFDNQRNEIVSRCLEVLGGGHALDGFLVGKGLNAEALAVRSRLDAFIKAPLSSYDAVDRGPRTSGRPPEYFDRLIKARQPRLQIMANAARKADLTIVSRAEEKSKAELAKQQQKEKKRSELTQNIQEIRSNLDATTGYVEELAATNGAIKELAAIYEQADDEAIKDLLTIDYHDTQDPKEKVSLSITENKGEATRLDAKISELENEVQIKKDNSSEIKQQLSSLRVRRRLLTEISQAVQRLNYPNYQRETPKKTGFGGLGKPMRTAAILSSAFDIQSALRLGDRRWYGGSDDIRTRIEAIKSPQKAYRQEKNNDAEPLAQLQLDLENVVGAEDILSQEQEIRTLSRLTHARKLLAEQSVNQVNDTITSCIRNTAIHLINIRLKEVLESQHRIKWE